MYWIFKSWRYIVSPLCSVCVLMFTLSNSVYGTEGGVLGSDGVKAGNDRNAQKIPGRPAADDDKTSVESPCLEAEKATEEVVSWLEMNKIDSSTSMIVGNLHAQMMELASLVDEDLRVSEKVAHGVQMKVKEDAPDNVKESIEKAWGGLSIQVLSYDLHKEGVKVGDIVKLPSVGGVYGESRHRREIDSNSDPSVDSEEEQPFTVLAEISQENGRKKLYLFREDGSFESAEQDQSIVSGGYGGNMADFQEGGADRTRVKRNPYSCSGICGWLLGWACGAAGYKWILKVVPRCVRFCWNTFAFVVPAAVCSAACVVIHAVICYLVPAHLCEHGCEAFGFSR
ncbi:hypothetical protein [Pasteuria penetrans]|uniref:hypothetical protein n=1 Tax=Pasteuria penetrans TaxID=86005 RepID=UPI000FB2E10C|nr:hypothetical protein [Pasteuria penetrans]